MPVSSPFRHDISADDREHQARLIREFDTLNTQIDDLLQRQPSLEAVYQQHLAAVFPGLPYPINPNRIFYSRYREPPDGEKQHLSSVGLGVLLNTLRAPDGASYLTEPGAFYREPDTLEADKRIAMSGDIAALPGALEIAVTLRLNDFWNSQEAEQPALEEHLIALCRQVLAHQLALRTLDATLSAEGQALAANVLKYPDAPARESAFAVGSRPGVYRLALQDGSLFAAAFILAANGATPPPGRVMLYSPGEGFEEFQSLGQLNDAVAARLRAGDAAGTRLAASLPAQARAQLSGLPALAAVPVVLDADVIADSVRTLRSRQYFNVRAALRAETLPVTGELDLAADLAAQLDVSTVLAARNLRLVEPREPDWLRNASAQDQARYRQLELSMLEHNEALLPLMAKIQSLTLFSENETHRVLKLQKPDYAEVTIAPYKSLVHLRLASSYAFQATGYRDDETGTVYASKDPKINLVQYLGNRQLTAGTWSATVLVELRTLGTFARRNVEPWSAHEAHRTLSATANLIDDADVHRGRLTDADLRALARQANIGAAYEAYLRAAFAQDGEAGAFAGAWQNANATKLRKDVLQTRLNPAAEPLFTFKTPGSGLDWIQTIAEHPDSAIRPQVGGFDIEPNLLMLGGALASGRGGQVVNGVLVIQRKGTRTSGVSVLYTPDAPDGMPFRELVNGLADLDTLKLKPEWRAYLTARMATNDPEELTHIFSDTRSAHRYAVSPVTGHLHAQLFSTQLGFELAHADFRARSNEEISRESTVNAFMFGVGVADLLIGLVPAKNLQAFVSRAITRTLQRAQKLGHRIHGLVGKRYARPTLVSARTSVQPLEPAWIDVAPYRLPTPIETLFDVELFAQANNYRLVRKSGSAPCFIDGRNRSFIAMPDNSGHYHLYASYVRDGARYVKHPQGQSMDFMVVPGDAKSWKPRFDKTTVGGGPAWSRLNPPTAAQQVDSDLRMALQYYSPPGHKKYVAGIVDRLSESQKTHLLSSTRLRLGMDEATFRQTLSKPQLSQSMRTSMLELMIDVDIFKHLHTSADFLTPPLSLAEMDLLFVKMKRILGRNEHLNKSVQSAVNIIDPDTGAQFIGCAITPRHLKSLSTFENKYAFMFSKAENINAYINENKLGDIVLRIAAKANVTRPEAIKLMLADPEIVQTFNRFQREYALRKLKQIGVDSYAEAFKQTGIPYISLTRSQTGAEPVLKMVDSLTVSDFEKNITRFSSPLDPVSTRVQTHPTTRPPPMPDRPLHPTQPTPRAVSNIVTLDELADTQIPLLPESARTKINEIIEDIRGGRVTRKKIGNHSYVDLPQVEAGSGRGRWRVAFEKTGKDGESDIYILRGIIDYHASKPIAWGM